MKLTVIGRTSIREIQRAPIRSALTILGVVVGVASVIAMVSIGNGARLKIAKSILDLNANLVTLSAIPTLESNFSKESSAETLTSEDYLAVRASSLPIAALTRLSIVSGADALARGRHLSVDVFGLDAEADAILNQATIAGAFFSPQDVESASAVCLLTTSLASELFQLESPIGKLITIRGSPFLIVGVVEDEKVPGLRTVELKDLSVYVPVTSLLRRLDRTLPVSFLVRVLSAEDMQYVESQLRRFMEERRGLRRVDFVTSTVTGTIEAYTESTKSLTIMLAAIGSISLIVGGIGIMNIMIVSVTERTREIGIRLALGTKRRDIFFNFILEAVLLSVVGGMVGTVVGLALGLFVVHLNSWPISISIGSILAAFGLSVAVGAFFGYYPARRAASLGPLAAIRGV